MFHHSHSEKSDYTKLIESINALTKAVNEFIDSENHHHETFLHSIQSLQPQIHRQSSVPLNSEDQFAGAEDTMNVADPVSEVVDGRKELTTEVSKDSESDSVAGSDFDSLEAPLDDAITHPPRFLQPQPVSGATTRPPLEMHEHWPKHYGFNGDGNLEFTHRWPSFPILEDDATDPNMDLPIIDTRPYDPGLHESPNPPAETKQPCYRQIPDFMRKGCPLVSSPRTMTNCVILSVTPANQDIVKSDLIKVSRQVDPSSARTSGMSANALDVLEELDTELAHLGRLVGMWFSLLNFSAKCGFPTSACHVLAELPEQDVLSWTAVTQGCVAKGNGSEKGQAEWVSNYEVVLGLTQVLAYFPHDCVPFILHGDVSTTNMLFGLAYHHYFADLGLTRIASEYGANTNSKKIQQPPYLTGSYGYMFHALASMQQIPHSSVVYIFGVVLFELLTGRHPLVVGLVCFQALTMENKSQRDNFIEIYFRFPLASDKARIYDWVQVRQYGIMYYLALGDLRIVDQNFIIKPKAKFEGGRMTLGELLALGYIVVKPPSKFDNALSNTLVLLRYLVIGSYVVIVVGTFTLRAKLWSSLDIQVAMFGGVHFSLLPKFRYDIGDSYSLDYLIDGIFPLLRKHIEPNCHHAQIQINISYVSSFREAIYKAKCRNKFSDGHPGSSFQGNKAQTGLESSHVLKAANEVVDYVGTVLHEFHFTVQIGIGAIEDVIYHIETYDLTTTRASTPIFLMSQKIKSLGVKWVIFGEGSDVIFGGYMYFHKVPNKEEFHKEACHKIKALHQYVYLQENKSTFPWNLEAREPFFWTRGSPICWVQEPTRVTLCSKTKNLGPRSDWKVSCSSLAAHYDLEDKINLKESVMIRDKMGPSAKSKRKRRNLKPQCLNIRNILKYMSNLLLCIFY